MKKKTKAVCEIQLKTRGSTSFWGRVESIPVEPPGADAPASVRSAIIDITERKEAEVALQESEEKYRDLVESVNSIIIQVDERGRVIFLNRFALDFFGYPLEELSEKGVVGTIIPAEVAAGHNLKDLLGYVGRYPDRYRENELENRRRNGERVWVSWTIRALHDRKGLFSGILAVGNDVSERRRLEEQLRQAQKMEAVGTLAGGIAHDFNNVLAAIMGFSEMALDDSQDNPGVAGNLERVLKAAKRARDLVRQILVFSRKAPYKRDPLSLTPLVKETVQLLRASIPATIEIRLTINSTSDTVFAAPVEVQQILMNIATNASLAMEKKGGEMEIGLTDVFFQRGSPALDADAAPGEYLQITVRDTGVGMSQEVRKRAFEPFFTTREVGKGTGMGLAVVYGIVKELGGMINIESEPGKGSTFRVFLPKADIEAAAEGAAPVAIQGGKERILFVDDEEMLVLWGKATLERLGYNVTGATGPQEALRVFADDPAQFDLVITDQAMSRQSGADLAREMLETRMDLPIILCTGHSEVITPETAKKIGIREFLMKPLGKQELAEAVRRVLDTEKKKD